MACYFKNTNKDIILHGQDKEDYRNNKICRVCGKNLESDKVRDLCHLTCKNWGPAHCICKINVTQKQSNFVPFSIHNISNHVFHVLFWKLVDKKNDKVKIDIILKTKEEYKSATYGCIRFTDS